MESKNKKLIVVWICFQVFFGRAEAAMVVINPSQESHNNIKFAWEKIQQANQIAELAGHTQQLAFAVTNLEEQLDYMRLQLEAMTKNYHRASGFGERIEELTGNLMKTTSSFTDTFDLDPTKSGDMKQILNGLFAPSTTSNRFNYNQVKEAYQQRAYKGALETAELVIANSEDRAKDIEREVMKINITNQQKDSIDVLARLVGEMLVEQQKTNLLLAQIARSSASDRFIGEVQDAKVGTDTYRSKAMKANFTSDSPSDFTLPSGKKGYDPFKVTPSKRRQREEENSWSPFLND